MLCLYSIFKLTPITLEDIKKAYRQAASKYHPDHNPAGIEMMKLVNAAYEALKEAGEEQLNQFGQASRDYGAVFNAALNAILGLGLEIEICGAWIWVSGDTKPHKEALKDAHYLWSPKKCRWYFRPENHKSRNRHTWDMDKIRSIHGSQSVRQDLNPRQIAA